jgi:hypothetical protein
LYFRPLYGASSLDGARFLGPDAAPAAAVVVHVVRWRGFYPNIFVFEMARQIGLPTVEFRPARVFLNGEPRGTYVLTERVMPDGWGRTYFGDTDFYMYVYKGETKLPSLAAHAELEEWVLANAPITLQEAAERIDIANLTAHLFTVMFSFTTDWAQGAALLDRNAPGARWFWIHWDMDQSFYLRGQTASRHWAQPFMKLITLDGTRDELEAYGIVTDDRHYFRHRNDLRRTLLLQLLQDETYREYFVRFVTDALNHRLTPAYFQELLARYRDLETPARPRRRARTDLAAYFRRRPDFVRAEIADYFDLGEPLTVHVVSAPETKLLIDGHAGAGQYEGHYFRGQRLTVKAAGDTPVAYWLVDGRRIDGPLLDLVIEADSRIEAIFDGSDKLP